MRANIGMRLRPHAKTQRMPRSRRWQIAAGAGGRAQKLSEAQALAEAGVADLYISNEVVDAGKLAELAALAACAGTSPSRSTQAWASTGWPPR